MNASFEIKFSKCKKLFSKDIKCLNIEQSFHVTRSRILSKRVYRQRDTFFHEEFLWRRKNGGFSRDERALFSFGYATDCVTRPFRPFHLHSTFVDVVVSGRVLSTSSTVGLSGSQAGTKHRFTTFPRHNFLFHTHLKSAPYFSSSPSLYFFPFLFFFFFDIFNPRTAYRSVGFSACCTRQLIALSSSTNLLFESGAKDKRYDLTIFFSIRKRRMDECRGLIER